MNWLGQPTCDALYSLDLRLLTEQYLYNSIYNCIYIVKLENAQNGEFSGAGVEKPGMHAVRWGRAADAQRRALGESGVNAVCVNTDDMYD
jgi:hypothetical protein